MSFLSAVLYVVNADGSRVAVRRSDGTYAPLVLKIGAGLAPTVAQSGGLDVLTLAVDTDALPGVAGVLPSTPSTIPLRGADGEVRAGWIELDINGPVADDGEVRLPEGGSVIGRVATGGGANATIAALSGTTLYLGSYRTGLILRTDTDIEFQRGIGNTMMGRFVGATPNASLEWRITAAGLEWYETGDGVRQGARRWTPVEAANLHAAKDMQYIRASGSTVVDGIQAPTAIDECTCFIVEAYSSGVDLLPNGGENINGVAGAYTVLAGDAVMFIANGVDGYRVWPAS